MRSRDNKKHRIINYTENAKHLYDYVRAHPWSFKFSYFISIFSWFVVGLTYLYSFDRSSPLAWFFLIVLLYIVFYNLLSKIISLHYKKFDLVYHNQLKFIWSHKQHYPTVDVFLPVCGESYETLRNTWDGVQQLVCNYPGTIIPYVLDDKGDEGTQKMAIDYNFSYISRPNKGEMKKAGNIKYAFDRTDGEFILILDADFRPEPNLLEELMPYSMSENTRDRGETIGIIQSPQAFLVNSRIAKEKPLSYGAATIQDYFYHFIQVSRQEFGRAAICVGSNAVYRRNALQSIGGTAQVEHSEDVWTGFRLLKMGWQLKYIPLCVAFGECPDNAQAFYKQQSRWCSGSMSLMTSKEFWTAPLPWYSKLCFISGFSFYISSIVYLTLPFITILKIAYGNFEVSQWYYFFISIMGLNALFLLSFHIYPRWRYSTIVAHMLASWSYIFTLVNLVLRRKEPWLPTGAKMKLSPNFLLLRRTIVTYIILLIFAGFYSLYLNNTKILEPGFFVFCWWLLLSLCNHMNALYGSYIYVTR